MVVKICVGQKKSLEWGPRRMQAFLEDCKEIEVWGSKSRDTKHSPTLNSVSGWKNAGPKTPLIDATAAWLALGDEMMEMIWPLLEGSFKSYCVLPPSLFYFPLCLQASVPQAGAAGSAWVSE